MISGTTPSPTQEREEADGMREARAREVPEPLTRQALRQCALERQGIERRAIEAVNWGMPAVNYDLMRQAMCRDARGEMNQIVYWSRLFDWKNQMLTPNPDVIYAMPFFDLSEVGPMVIEIPPAGEDGSITGTIMDCWQAPLEDVGPAGKDAGAGGKYVVLQVAPDVPGTMSRVQYETFVADLVNYMDYMAEPVRNKRIHLGIVVLLFLSVLFFFAYWMKREYWKDLH